MNLPNKLTLFRIILIPFVMYFIMAGVNVSLNMYIGLSLFIIACITDFLDGYIARKYNLVTNLGKFLDPVADKLLIICVLICFVQLSGVNPIFEQTWWVLALIVARELSITAFRTIAASTGTVIAANIYGKLKTNFQMFWVIALILYLPLQKALGAQSMFMSIFNVVTWVLLIGTALLTVVSFVIYLIQNKNVLKETK